MAGLFDGEGHVRMTYPKARNGQRYPRLYCQITGTDRRVLDWARDAIKAGSVQEKYDHRVEEGHHQAYDWMLSYRKAEKFLRMIQPHLRIKEKEVAAALAEAYP